MLLDVGSEIFVCVGNDAPADEKKNAMIKSQNFLLGDASKPNYTPLHRVKTGQSPNNESWSKAFDAAAAEPEPAAPAPVRPCACGACTGLPFIPRAIAHLHAVGGMVLQTAEEGEAPAPAEPAPAPAPAGDGSMYSLAELQAGCPAGVEAASKEKSLNDEDFEATFKMSRGDFDAQPKWKRDQAKKDA